MLIAHATRVQTLFTLCINLSRRLEMKTFINFALFASGLLGIYIIVVILDMLVANQITQLTATVACYSVIGAFIGALYLSET